MNTMLTVPACMVLQLRHGLHEEIGNAAEVISRVVEAPGREEHTEWYRPSLEHLNAALKLLNVLGWKTADQVAKARVNLHEHGEILLTALRGHLLVEDDALDEAAAVDAERAKRGKPPKREATARRVLALRDYIAHVEARMDTLPRDEHGGRR
jgi:hypothetical protein